VLVEIAQAVSGQIVNEHGFAAGNRHPGVGAATVGVNASIGDAQGRKGVHDYVERAGFGGTDTDVGTAGALVVRVRGHFGKVTESGLRLHCMLGNIPQLATGRRTFWR
jgi:hypothetical protein